MLSARELPAKQSQPSGGAVGRAARVAPGREKRIAAVCWRATAEPVGAAARRCPNVTAILKPITYLSGGIDRGGR